MLIALTLRRFYALTQVLRPLVGAVLGVGPKHPTAVPPGFALIFVIRPLLSDFCRRVLRLLALRHHSRLPKVLRLVDGVVALAARLAQLALTIALAALDGSFRTQAYVLATGIRTGGALAALEHPLGTALRAHFFVGGLPQPMLSICGPDTRAHYKSY